MPGLSSLTDLTKRLKHLDWVDTIQAKHSIERRFDVDDQPNNLAKAARKRRKKRDIFGMFHCERCKRSYEIAKCYGASREIVELHYYEWTHRNDKKDCPECIGEGHKYRIITRQQNIVQGKKQCACCRHTKMLRCFYRDKTKKDGYSSWCTVCKSRANKLKYKSLN